MKNLEDAQLESEIRELADPSELDELMMLVSKLSSLDQPELAQIARESTLRHLVGRQAASRRAPFRRAWLFVGGPLLAALSLAVVVLAQGATPATPLYSVKRLSESARLAVAFTPESKAQLCAVFMQRRASELASLPSGQSPVIVASLTDEVTAEAVEYAQFANQSGTDRTHIYTRLRQDAQSATSSLQSARRTQTGAAQTTSINAAITQMVKLTHLAV